MMQLEEVLMMADIGAATTGEIIDDLRAVAKEDQLDPDDVKSVLRGRLIDALSVKGRAMNLARQEGEAEDQVRRIGIGEACS
jgi:signal recognition particle GTPase